MTAPRRVAGMTLLELLLAMILLGIGATIVYAAMRTSLGVAARGDLVSQQQDWMRTTATLLHRQLVAAQPLPLVQPGPGDAPVVFVGEPDQIRVRAEEGVGSVRFAVQQSVHLLRGGGAACGDSRRYRVGGGIRAESQHWAEPVDHAGS